MPDEQYLVVEVRSNVDRLSASTVHRLFADMIGRVMRSGEGFLRATAPRGKSERLSRAVSSVGPHDDGDIISASVGVPPIADAPSRFAKTPSPDFFSPVAGGHGTRDYPLFVDRGTGMFGSAYAPIHSHTGGPLRFEGADGGVVFRQSVKGQPAAHFMLATFEEMRRVALPIDAKLFEERVKRLYAEPNPPGI
jgi:hypothetical protein